MLEEEGKPIVIRIDRNIPNTSNKAQYMTALQIEAQVLSTLKFSLMFKFCDAHVAHVAVCIRTITPVAN